MQKVQPLHDFEQIKQLADPRRLQILRLLMAEPATLSQLASALRQSPAWVRHHILALQAADLVELAEIRKTGTVTEKYYRAKAGAFLLQELALPKSKKPVVVFSGSHDLALEAAAAHLERHALLLTLPVGSLDGLVNLRQGLCQVSGTHLRDENGEYNTPYLRRLFPDRDMEVMTLAHRVQGLMAGPGNPKGVRGVSEWSADEIRAAWLICDRYGWHKPITEQPQYNLFHRYRVEKEYARLYEDIGLGTTIWSPLASGLLTGKYNQGIPEGSRGALPGYEWLRNRLTDQQKLAKVAQLAEVAGELGCTLAQFSIAWCARNPHVSTVITGASRVEQVRENMKALDVLPKLTDDVLKRVDEIMGQTEEEE
jgi:DNA-binding transcriptional ArsR family regulator